MRVAVKQIGRRFAPTAIVAVLLPLLIIIFAPDGRLPCGDPYVTEESADGQWTLTVCSRPMFFALPGSGSDAPGWIVLREETSSIRGVSSLAMLQLYGGTISGNETEWTSSHVRRWMVFEMPLSSGQGAWIDGWMIVSGVCARWRDWF